MSKAGDPSILLKRLEAALAQAEPKMIVGAQELAHICGMTWRNLNDRYVANDLRFPIKTIGTNGKNYEFELVRVLKHMIKVQQRKIAEDSNRAKQMREVTGIQVASEKHAPTSWRDVRDAIDGASRFLKLKQEQGQLVPLAEVAERFDAMLDIIVRNISGLPVALDPLGKMPAEQRAMIERVCRDTLLQIQAEATEATRSTDAVADARPDAERRRGAGEQQALRGSRRRASGKAVPAHAA